MNRVQMPNGYRLLNIGEKTQSGDLYRAPYGKWIPEESGINVYEESWPIVRMKKTPARGGK